MPDATRGASGTRLFVRKKPMKKVSFCRYCSKILQNEDLLSLHLNEEHRYECMSCHAIFSREPTFRKSWDSMMERNSKDWFTVRVLCKQCKLRSKEALETLSTLAAKKS
jgi:hypothetical protein